MPTERMPMRKIREILRLRWQLKLTVREVARGVGVSVGVAQKIVSRAAAAGLSWELAEALDEVALEEKLYGRPTAPGIERPRPDPVYMHQELRRTGVTLELLHLEYLERHPEGLRYTAFCDAYRRWQAKVGVVLRQVHKAGEKCFVDYSGKRPAYVDPKTGERVEVELFVAVLGASDYTYVEATETQQVPDFLGSHVRAYAYFGGVTEITVPDQLKSAVVRACRYEPGIQRTYADLARHYGTAIVPARPYKPRDKAKVEVGVQIAQRWIVARLRNETYFSLADLNARIAELLEELNTRPMKKLGGTTRRALFEKYDRPALRPLPASPYELMEWSQVRVNRDHHVEVDKHWYSAPYVLVHQELWACVTATTAELLHRSQRVAFHPRSHAPHEHTTDTAHMPEAHRRHAAGLIVHTRRDVSELGIYVVSSYAGDAAPFGGFVQSFTVPAGVKAFDVAVTIRASGYAKLTALAFGYAYAELRGSLVVSGPDGECTADQSMWDHRGAVADILSEAISADAQLVCRVVRGDSTVAATYQLAGGVTQRAGAGGIAAAMVDTDGTGSSSAAGYPYRVIADAFRWRNSP